MGYNTDWHGGLELNRNLTRAEQQEWDDVVENRHDSEYGYGDPKREYPSIWCNFEVEGRRFQWNGNEKTYEGYGWILFFLKWTKEKSKDNLLYAEGEMTFKGEDESDIGKVIVVYYVDNKQYGVEEHVAEIEYRYFQKDKQHFKKGGKLKVKGRSWYEAGGMVKQADKMRRFKNEMDTSIRQSKGEIEESKRNIEKNRQNLIDSAENIKREEKSIGENIIGMREDAKEAQEFERRARKYAKGGEVKEIELEIEKLKKENPEGFKREIALLEQIAKLKKENPEGVYMKNLFKEEIEFYQNRLDSITDKNWDGITRTEAESIMGTKLRKLHLDVEGWRELIQTVFDSGEEARLEETITIDPSETGPMELMFASIKQNITLVVGIGDKTGLVMLIAIDYQYTHPNGGSNGKRITYRWVENFKEEGWESYEYGGKIYGSAYQDEVEDRIKDLSGDEYEVFAFDNNIDPEDANEMSNFISDLDQDEAEKIISQLKGEDYAKGGKTNNYQTINIHNSALNTALAELRNNNKTLTMFSDTDVWQFVPTKDYRTINVIKNGKFYTFGGYAAMVNTIKRHKLYLKENYAKGGKILSKEVFEWVEVYKRNNQEYYDNLNEEVEYEEEKIDLNNANDLPEVFFLEIREKLEEDGHSEEEIDNAIEEYFNKYYDEDKMFITNSYAKGGRTYSRENRPSPSDSATMFNVGYRSRGNDGNIWEIKENIKGTHRWVKLKG